MDDSEEKLGPVSWSEQEAVETLLEALDYLRATRTTRLVEAFTNWLWIAMSDAGHRPLPDQFHAFKCLLRSLLNLPQSDADSRIAADAGQLALGAQLDSRPRNPDSRSHKVRVLSRFVERLDAVLGTSRAAAASKSTVKGGAVPYASQHDRDAKTLAWQLEPHFGPQMANAETIAQLTIALAKSRTKGKARLLAIARAVGITITADDLKKAFRRFRGKSGSNAGVLPEATTRSQIPETAEQNRATRGQQASRRAARSRL